MNMFQIKKFSVLLVFAVLIFAGCSDNTTNPVPVKPPVPQPPKNIMATSIDSMTVRLIWTASTSEDSSWFKDYVLVITSQSSGVLAPIYLSKTDNPIDIKNLNEGEIYTFQLTSRNSELVESAQATAVRWSPARRFDSFKLYETKSSYGSGLMLYDATSKGPLTYTIANSDKWDLALDTREISAGVESWDIGCPGLTSYTISNPRNTLIIIPNDSYKGVASLDDVFDTEMLNPTAQQLINFDTAIKGFVFAVKTQDGHFAKVLVKANNGVLLQGTKPNRYVELDISYQTTTGVQFAKVNSGDEVQNIQNTSGIKVINVKKIAD